VVGLDLLWRLADWLSSVSWVASELPTVAKALRKVPNPPQVSGWVLLVGFAALAITYGTDVADRRRGAQVRRNRLVFQHGGGLVSEYALTSGGEIRMKLYNLPPHVFDDYFCTATDPDTIQTSGQASVVSGSVSRTALIYYSSGFSGAPSVTDGPYEVTWMQVTRLSGMGSHSADLLTDLFKIRDGGLVD
jgi:hypothetical protein